MNGLSSTNNMNRQTAIGFKETRLLKKQFFNKIVNNFALLHNFMIFFPLPNSCKQILILFVVCNDR